MAARRPCSLNSQTLSPQAADGMILVPPFGANGVEFDNQFTAMYVANTAYHSIVKIPVTLNQDGSVTVAGTAAVLTTGINAPDGIAVDSHDNLWVVANQQDEIDVIDPNAIDALGDVLPKIIARRGDFRGIGEDGRSTASSSRQARRSVRPEICLCLQYCTLPALRRRAGNRNQFAVDTRGQALHDRQDTRCDSAPDRSGGALGRLKRGGPQRKFCNDHSGIGF